MKKSEMYFSEKEFVDPVFDGNPANFWIEMPIKVQKNLMYVWELLEILREAMGLPIRINSTWRPRGRKSSAHYVGKAVDIQFASENVKDKKYIEAMEYLEDTTRFNMFRAILEWQGRRPWIHIDRNFPSERKLRRMPKQRSLMVAFPKDNKMIYLPYEGDLPQTYVPSRAPVMDVTKSQYIFPFNNLSKNLL